MFSLISFLFGLFVGALIVWLVLRFKQENASGTGIVESQVGEKKRNKEAILGILETQAPLTNNHIEQLLGVSDATATRYLEELEKEGKIRQVGKTGRGVYYEKV